MASAKVPAENQPLFLAALPSDARVETIRIFGGVAAKVNGHLFAGLFGRSAMVFDPRGDGRARNEKVMLPEHVLRDAAALR